MKRKLKCECGACSTCYARKYYRTRVATDPERAAKRNAARQGRRKAYYGEAERERERLVWRNHPQLAHDRRKAKRHRISLGELWAMRFSAEHKCQMPECGRPLTLGGWGGDTEHVDHCHETGRVRGLLCSDCNMALGGWEKLRGRAELYLQGAKNP